MHEPKFTEVLLKAVEEQCRSYACLDRDGNAKENYTLVDLRSFTNGIITEENKFFKYLDELFEKIPADVWNRAASKIALELHVLAFQEDAELYNKRTKHLRSTKGNGQKKRDTGALKKALPILEKFFDIRIGDLAIKKTRDIPSDMIDHIPPTDFYGLRAIETINTLIANIESGEFDQGFYKEQRGSKKEDLKNYLLALNKEYNAKGSRHINNFIKGMRVEQYANF
jgi:hypothetical protein